jgi:hypothetical protein
MRRRQQAQPFEFMQHAADGSGREMQIGVADRVRDPTGWPVVR